MRVNSLSPIDAYKLKIIGSDNGLLPNRRHAIIWPTAEKYCQFDTYKNNEIVIKIHTFSVKKMHSKTSAKLRTFEYNSTPNVHHVL